MLRVSSFVFSSFGYVMNRMRFCRLCVLGILCGDRGAGSGVAAAAVREPPEATRPPENNDRTLRPLGPDEIPPNLSFYAIDPLYKPGVPLGWASARITEKLNRGLTAWRCSKEVAYI